MSVTITDVTILDPRSPFHGKKTNVLIKQGKIAAVGKRAAGDRQTLAAKGAYLSPGWFDLQAHFCDPGEEHKEDLDSGRAAAMAGGFTEVALLPNTKPVIQTKNDIKYLTRDNGGALVQIRPLAAVSVDTAGEDFTEMEDLHTAGAVAFSDGLQPLHNTDLLRKSLQYVQKFNGLVIDRPQEQWLSRFGVMNESHHSALLGMKGMPALAEEVAVARDLQILAYTGGRLHLSNISTAGAVAQIRQARKKGLPVTCDVALHNLLYSDAALLDYDTVYKVNPPLRTPADIKALAKGLQDGTIDAIVSDHQPQDEESKKLEFDLAAYGMNNLQVALPLLVRLLPHLPLELLIDKLTSGPRNVLGLPQPVIEEGQGANLTLFDTTTEWRYNSQTNRSKSTNSPLFGSTVQGKVRAVFNNGQTRVF